MECTSLGERRLLGRRIGLLQGYSLQERRWRDENARKLLANKWYTVKQPRQHGKVQVVRRIGTLRRFRVDARGRQCGHLALGGLGHPTRLEPQRHALPRQRHCRLVRTPLIFTFSTHSPTKMHLASIENRLDLSLFRVDSFHSILATREEFNHSQTDRLWIESLEFITFIPIKLHQTLKSD